MSLSIDDDWLKPTEPQAEDQRDAGHTSSVTGGLKSTILLTKINGKYLYLQTLFLPTIRPDSDKLGGNG